MCAPPDCAERLAEVGIPLVPVGEPVRPLVHGATPPSMADVPRRVAELIAAWFDQVTAAAEGCDAVVASGLIPAVAGARSVAEKHGRRALVARGWADLALIDDRDDCFAVGEVNQQALFGRVAAVVHHGGAGTTTTAARAGTPQVVVPQWADQPYWASRAAGLGIGAAHDVQVPTTESLSAALGTALTPQTRARATGVAGMIRTDGAGVAAKLLVDAVSPERPQVSA
jgi:vancomycin aglycone glucosyltransferase